MAIMLEVLCRLKIIVNQDKSIIYILFFSTISGVFSIIFGILLAEEGSYNEQTLFFHRWLGVATTILSFIGWWSKNNFKKNIFTLTLIFLGISLVLTGHLGGTLTHGPNYLKILNYRKSDTTLNNIPGNLDSIIVYKNIIQPIFKTNCYQCHNSQKTNGGFDLTLLERKNNTNIINPTSKKNILENKIFLRTTLPKSHEKFMPKDGEQLTFGEISLIRWWIEDGSKLNKMLKDYKITEDIKFILKRDYKINYIKQSFIESLKVDSVNAEKLDSLNSLGWEISSLSQKNNLLEVSVFNGYQIQPNQLNELLEIKDNITWLNLGNQNLTDDDLYLISKFKNLTRLRIENNSISDLGIEYLIALPNLLSLNVINTSITDKSINHIKNLNSLQKIFIWKTNISQSAIEELKSIQVKLTIVGDELL